MLNLTNCLAGHVDSQVFFARQNMIVAILIYFIQTEGGCSQVSVPGERENSCSIFDIVKFFSEKL